VTDLCWSVNHVKPLLSLCPQNVPPPPRFCICGVTKLPSLGCTNATCCIGIIYCYMVVYIQFLPYLEYLVTFNKDRSEFWMHKMKAEMVFYKSTVLCSYVVMCCSIELFCCSFCDRGGISCEVTQVNLSERWNHICPEPCHCHFLVWIETAKMDHCHMYFSASWCQLFSVTYCVFTVHVFLQWNVTRTLYQNTFFLQTMEEPNFVPSSVWDRKLPTE